MVDLCLLFGTIDPKAGKYYDISPYAYCRNNPVKNIDPNGMDVWSTTDPEEIRRAIESLLRGGSFQYNSNWMYRSDRDFLNPYGGSYYPGLNYNSRTGQLWFLSGGMASDSYVSQLTRISKGMWGNSYAGYGSLDEFVGNDMWQRISDGLNGASFVVGGTAYSGGRALDRTMTYYISSFSQARPSQVMFKLPGYNMYLPPNMVRGGLNVLKTTGKSLGYLGLGITSAEILTGQKDIIGEGGLDLIFGGVAFVPGWGWVVSGVYFGGKYFLEYTENDFWNKH